MFPSDKVTVSAARGGPQAADRTAVGRARRFALTRFRGYSVALLAVALFVTVLNLNAPKAHAADLVDVTVTIDRVIQVQNPDPAPFEFDGDYYSKVRIGDNQFQTSPTVDNNPDFAPFWRFTQKVDRSLGLVSVRIQLWDADFLTPPDDIMDLNPADGVTDLILLVNPKTGEWVGDVPKNVGFSQGDGDHEHFGTFEGGEAAKIFFDVGLGNDDIDGDGIPDGIERTGIRDDYGNLIVDMKALGADPCRKTIATQIDYMTGAADRHSHQPKAAALAEVVAAFNAAPVTAVSPCPYQDIGFPERPSGVNFVSYPGHPIPEQPILGIDNDFKDVRNGNFYGALRPYFHYGIFAHDQAAGSSSSGKCCNDGKDFLVTLGSWHTTCVSAGPNKKLETSPGSDDVVDGQKITMGPNRTCDSVAVGDDQQIYDAGKGSDEFEVGTVRDQSGSIMHELGHALGLGHGGADTLNNKPNFLSVMNYKFDPGGIPDPTIKGKRLDYSRKTLPSLDELNLSEAAGIGDGTDVTSWTDPFKITRSSPGNAALDWNGNGFINSGTDRVDLNNDGVASVMTGHDDWSTLNYLGGFNGGGAPPAGHGPEITFEEAFQNEQVFGESSLAYNGDFTGDFHDPASLSATLTNKATGAPIVGATLAFTMASESCNAVSDGTGRAACSIVPAEASGTYPLAAKFSGLGSDQPSSASASFVVTREETSLSYTGQTMVANGTALTLSGVLTEDSHVPVSGRTVTFVVGSGASAQTCGGSTDAAGAVSCTIIGQQPLGPGTVSGNFVGDPFYMPSSGTTATIVFAFLSQGSFVIGQANTGAGSAVTFWGSQWRSSNGSSVGSAANSFNGFARDITNPPACAGTWSTGPGNSAAPPRGPLPSYMGVIGTSAIAKSGSAISGNIPTIVVVKTDPGYAPNPGHAGTGTVVARYC